MTDGAGNLPTNPYIGARPFRRNETIYGRAREARDLLSLLVGNRIVLLNSPSGAGKTSLIQAALIPRLEKRRFVVRPTIRVGAASPIPGANRYLLSVMQSLEEGRPAGEQLPPERLAGLSLREYLAERSAQGAENGQVLIFDQFEEVLTLDPADEAARLAFFEQLGDALADEWLWALFAIREEYVAALEPYGYLVPSRFATTFRLELLGVEAAGEAIRGPAASRGAAFDDDAVEALASDLAKIVVQDAQGKAVERTGTSVEPVQLQVVCYRLWEKRFAEGAAAGQTISLEDVRGLGSIDRALEEYYDSGVARATAAGQVRERAVRSWVDTQLITRQGFRSQVLAGNEGAFGLSEAALDGLTNAYLVREERRRGVTWLELAHDRLIAPVRASNTRWFAANLSPLQRQVEVWIEQGQPDSLLFRDADLAAAEQWAAANAAALTADEENFLGRCREERRRAEERARQARRIRNLAVGASIAAVAAIIAASTAFGFYGRAESNARVSRARELAAAARTQLQVDPQLSLLLALRAANTTLPGDPVPPEPAQVMQQATQDSRVTRVITLTHPPTGVAYSPDGKTFAATTYTDESAATHGVVLFWDSADPQAAPRSLDVQAEAAYGLAYSPDGRLLATSDEAKLSLWPAAGGTLLRSTAIYSPNTPLQLAFSPDSSLLAASSDGQQLYLLKTADLTPATPLLDHPAPVHAVAFSPDGARLATAADDGVARIWDAHTGKPEPPLHQQATNASGNHGLFALAFSPDGKLLATGGQDGLVHIWDVERGSERYRSSGHSGSVRALAFSADGSFLASGSDDTTIRLWDVAAGKELFSLRGHTGRVTSIAFSPDGASLLSGGDDSTLRVWDLRLIHGQAVNSVASSPDGRMIATAADSGTVKLWDAASGRLAQTLPTTDTQMINLNFSPDGRHLAAAGASGSAYIWATAGPAEPRTVACAPGGCYSVAFSADSARLAAGGADGTVRIWDVVTLARKTPDLTAKDVTQINSLSFSADGSLLAAATDVGPKVWDLASGALHEPALSDDQAQSVEFSRQGLRLAVANTGAKPVVYDLAANTSNAIEKSPESLNRILFSADGKRLATANADGTVRVWDAATAQPLLTLTGMNGPNDADFSPDGSRLVIADKDGVARVALLDQGQLYRLAASRAVRPFTPDECAAYQIDPCAWDSGR